MSREIRRGKTDCNGPCGTIGNDCKGHEVTITHCLSSDTVCVEVSQSDGSVWSHTFDDRIFDKIVQVYNGKSHVDTKQIEARRQSRDLSCNIAGRIPE